MTIRALSTAGSPPRRLWRYAAVAEARVLRPANFARYRS